MDILKYNVKDPIILQSIFSNVFESELTATSKYFEAKPRMRHISPLLSVFWGDYGHCCGRWMPHGVCAAIDFDEVEFLINGHLLSSLKKSLEVAVCLANREYDYSFKRPGKMLILFISFDLLKPIFEALLHKSYNNELRSIMHFKSQEDKNELLSMLQPFIGLNSQELRPTLFDSQRIVEKFILSLDYEKEVCYERTYCRYLALQAHAFLIHNRHRALSMTEICQHLNASCRSIQNGFKEIYGMGVIEYHKMYRMTHVRKFLQANGTKDVVQVIKQFGFQHAGRFASTYRKTFGRNPSEEYYKSVHHDGIYF